MLIALICFLAGLYLLLMAGGLLQRRFFRKTSEYNRPALRLAIFLFGSGLLVMGSYQGCLYYSGYMQRISPDNAIDNAPGKVPGKVPDNAPHSAPDNIPDNAPMDLGRHSVLYEN